MYIYIHIYSSIFVVSVIPVVGVILLVAIQLPFLYCNYPQSLNSGKK